MEDIRERYREIQATGPPLLGRKPSDYELRVLREHKEKVRLFLQELTPEQRQELKHTSFYRPKEESASRKKSPDTSKTPQTEARVRPTLKMIQDKEFALCTSRRKFRFATAIPFCSHRNRSRSVTNEDDELGIDRRVFSNLFVDSETLTLPHPTDESIVQLLGHAADYTSGLCAESFYMAAKCEHKCDAQFIMGELQKSVDVASFGHHKLKLNESQKSRLIELGADPQDFHQNWDGTWLRGKDGRMPTRPVWKETRHLIFLYILREKFGEAPPGSTTQSTVVSLIKMIKEGILPYPIEHRRADAFWGDGGDGSGFNVLGKIIAQILFEIAGLVEKAPRCPETQCNADMTAVMFQPVRDYVSYEIL